MDSIFKFISEFALYLTLWGHPTTSVMTLIKLGPCPFFIIGYYNEAIEIVIK